MSKKDNVNHPDHYRTGAYECIDVMQEAIGYRATMDFCLCNAFKYLYRQRKKGDLEDLKKARWYLDRRIKMQEDIDFVTEFLDRQEGEEE